uniref:Nudix hydrolase domain-containing protein n=1 Tax=Ditylenchus dipsaci TaxID=166011 RepID=A0A915DKV8_9BILA
MSSPIRKKKRAASPILSSSPSKHPNESAPKPVIASTSKVFSQVVKKPVIQESPYINRINSTLGYHINRLSPVQKFREAISWHRRKEQPAAVHKLKVAMNNPVSACNQEGLIYKMHHSASSTTWTHLGISERLVAISYVTHYRKDDNSKKFKLVVEQRNYNLDAEHRALNPMEEQVLKAEDCLANARTWALPGGMVDPNETPKEGAEREFIEEALGILNDDKKTEESNKKDQQTKENIKQLWKSGQLIYKGYAHGSRTQTVLGWRPLYFSIIMSLR